MQKRTRLVTIIIILSIIWLILIKLGKEKASYQELALATTIYFVCCLPLLIYFGRPEKNIPYLPIFGIFYFIYFGLSIFNNYNLIRVSYLSPVIIVKCLNIALLGFISLMIAFYTPLGRIVDSVIHPLRIPWDPKKAYRLAMRAGFLGIIVHYFSLGKILPLSYSGLINFIINLSHLGIAVLFMLQLQNKLKFIGKIFLWLGLFIPKIFLDLLSGSTFPVILDFFILFFIYFYHYKSIPWLRIIAVAAIFFVMFSVRGRFRELTWLPESEYVNASVAEKLRLYVKLFYERLSGQKEQFVEAYDLLSVRTDNLVTFAKVVAMTPDYVPYWQGYTYQTLLTSFMPRFIFPGKSQKTLGQEFGHRYMLLNPTDTATSYNLPILVEMYVNFGPIAIIVGMFIMGIIFRALYGLFNHPASGEGGIIISTMIFTGLLNIEGDFSLVSGAILQYTILFYFIIKRMKLPIERIK